MQQEPMTASHIEFLEDVRRFAKYYNNLTLEERVVIKGEIDEGEYTSTLEGDTLNIITKDIDSYTSYKKQDKFLTRELGRVSENQYSDKYISEMKYDQEVARRNMYEIDKKYGLSQDDPKILDAIETREEYEQQVHDAREQYDELTDDNFDHYEAEMNMYSDPGLVVEKQHEHEILEDTDFETFEDALRR